MTNRPLIASLVACLILLVTSGSAQERHTLVYKFVKGNNYRFAQEMKMEITQEMMGQEMHISTDAKITSRLFVDDILSDGTMILMASLDSARAKVKSPMMDSTLVLRDLLGKRTRVSITPLGVVTKRETIDTVKLQMRLRAFASRDYTTLQRLPDKPVAVGDKWSSTVQDSAQTDELKTATSAAMEYTMVGSEVKLGRECLKIAFTGTISTTASGKSMGMEMFTEGSGKVNGTFFFDPAAGVSVAEEAALEQELTTALTGQQNMTIPSSQKTHMTRTLLTE